MAAIFNRKLFAAILTLALLAPVLSSTPASAAPGFSNGFENEGDTDGWNYPDRITRVSSGTNGVPSSAGDYHANLHGTNYMWWGSDPGGETVWPEFGYSTTIDIYLDMSIADGESQQTAQWNSAVNILTGSDPLAEGFFQLRTEEDSPGQWIVRGARVYEGFVTTDWIEITESGWYTMKQTFYEGTGGYLEIQLDFLDSDGNNLLTVVWDGLEDYSVANGDVGGNRYGWFSHEPFANLPIDNLSIDALPPPLPELTEVCKNRYNGDIRAPHNGACAPTENLVQDVVPPQHVICENRYNGDLRFGRGACAFTETLVEPEVVCVNRYNGDVRASRFETCASTEDKHQWAIQLAP